MGLVDAGRSKMAALLAVSQLVSLLARPGHTNSTLPACYGALAKLQSCD